MSGLDIFAIIILLILLAAIIVGWIFLAMLPGKIAKKRNHRQAEAINVGGWVSALLIGPWPIMLVLAYTRPVSSRALTEENERLQQRLSDVERELSQGEERTMIGFLTLTYAAILGLLVKFKVLPNKATTWLSIVVWVVILLIGLFIPMMWGVPSGPVRLMTYTVQVIPNVSGKVAEVPVKPNLSLKKGDTLFKLDPTVYRAAVANIDAKLKFERLRIEQYTTLARKQAGTEFRVEETRANVQQLEAQLEDAKWKLAETVVRAPSDGYVTALALRPGQRVTSLPLAPAMTFIDTSAQYVVLQIDQIYHRHVKLGQDVEIAFKTRPGKIFKGNVDGLIQVTSQSQLVTGGTVPEAQQISPEPLFVRLRLADASAAASLPAGTTGSAAVYTESVQFTHLIRRVMMRMQTYLNFIIPY